MQQMHTYDWLTDWLCTYRATKSNQTTNNRPTNVVRVVDAGIIFKFFSFFFFVNNQSNCYYEIILLLLLFYSFFLLFAGNSMKYDLPQSKLSDDFFCFHFMFVFFFWKFRCFPWILASIVPNILTTTTKVLTKWLVQNYFTRMAPEEDLRKLVNDCIMAIDVVGFILLIKHGQLCWEKSRYKKGLPMLGIV